MEASSSFPRFRASCNFILVLFHLTDIVYFYVKPVFTSQKTRNKQKNKLKKKKKQNEKVTVNPKYYREDQCTCNILIMSKQIY